ncbi:hypothetical protein [Kaistia granuli]|uniref:hypothetical protein n=1 Tax=Kaistia granuli TaxID=363259 RepID=UPI000379CE69|nr:hypothetical protein [Kaistia granuli]
MENVDAFDQAVRTDISTILTRKYRTVRHGGHDKEEHLRERQFWPDMQFHGVEIWQDTPGLSITFTPVNEPGQVYGYRIDMATALIAWGKRVGIRNPRQHPSMFAAELVWYMVTYIGAVGIEDSVVAADGIRWINKGTEVFEKLPGADHHHH